MDTERPARPQRHAATRPRLRLRSWLLALLHGAPRRVSAAVLAGFIASAIFAAGVSPPSFAQAQAPAQAPELLALIRDRSLPEISGLAASHRHRGLLWVHNDSGYAAQIHAIDRRGRRLASIDIDDVAGVDIEDMAGFEHEGRRMLLLADTGDNGGRRSEVALIVMEEPARVADAHIQPAWVQRFRWPDGPRDVEAVAVDAKAGEVLLISKKRVPAELFSLPLGPSESMQTAQRIGMLVGIEQPQVAELQGNPRFGRYRAQITAADLSNDGLQLAVLNYRRAHVFQRLAGESWASAVSRPPQELSFGWAAQAEAIAFDTDDGALLLGGERLPAPLIRLPLR